MSADFFIGGRWYSPEQAVIALRRDGQRIGEIAGTLGLPVAQVQSIIRCDFDASADNPAPQSAAINGSNALLAAIRRAHPDRCEGVRS